jgi:hypothetical protein
VIDAFRRAFRRITPAEVAARELAEAELSMLQAQTAREYAESVMSYNQARITRLRKYLATLERKP